MSAAEPPDRRMIWVGVLGALAVVPAGCGGGEPRCGDGVHQPDLGEQCDDGNDVDTDVCHNDCTSNLPGQFTVKWAFNADETVGFTGDSCTDMGVARVRVDLSGPAQASLTENCPQFQVVFSDLPVGSYQIAVTPLDGADGAKVGAAVQQTEMLMGGSIVTVVVPYTAWSDGYTGTFFFRLQWAGQDCASATPAVAQHVLRLEREGVPFAQMTDAGDPLDGSQPGGCRAFTEEFPQSALGIPFGPATFTVDGLDSVGDPQFSRSFDTFIGAGITNPEYHFDVASLAPDAGVPDASPPDAI